MSCSRYYNVLLVSNLCCVTKKGTLEEKQDFVEVSVRREKVR